MTKRNDFSWATTSQAFRKAIEEDGPTFVTIGVDVCVECGKPHEALKTCVHKRPPRNRYRAHAELGGLLDLNILQEIVEMNGYENLTDMCRRLVQLAKEGSDELVVLTTGVGDKVVRESWRQEQESKLEALRKSPSYIKGGR